MSALPVLHLEGIEINTMKWIDTNRPQHTEQPHRHDYYVIIWILQANGLHRVDFKSYLIEDQTLWFISPGQPHLLQAAPGAIGYVISFTDEFFCISENNRRLLTESGLFYRFSDFQPFKISTEVLSILSNLIGLLLKEYKASETFRLEAIRAYLKVFLIESARLFTSGIPLDDSSSLSRAEYITRAFREKLEKNFRKHLKIADYAQDLGLTANYLNQLIKKTTGFSASDLIRQRLLLEVKRQIFFGEKSAKEIAFELGFEDEAYFSRFFKNNTGHTFSEYRHSLEHGFLL